MTPYYERPEWAAWLASIREQPEDDHRRLVCADWLDELETDEAAVRAEFIRVCCGRRSRSDDAIARILGGLVTWAACGITADWSWHGGLAAEPYPDPVGVRLSNGMLIGYDRGFVNSVSGPLGVLHGGECERCEAHRPIDHQRSGWTPCPCGGTGHTPGVLGPLLSREPLTAAGIVVTDREPHPNSYGGTVCGWQNKDHPHQDYHDDLECYMLPGEIIDAMPLGWSDNVCLRWFNTPDAARLALCEALYRLHGPKSEVRA